MRQSIGIRLNRALFHFSRWCALAGRQLAFDCLFATVAGTMPQGFLLATMEPHWRKQQVTKQREIAYFSLLKVFK